MTRNHGITKITSVEEATAAWDSFFGRFFSNKIPEGVNSEFDPTLREFTPRKNQDAKYKSPFIDEGRTDHSDDFDEFLNGNTVTIPNDITLTEKGLTKVETAIQNGNFESSALRGKDHLYYALWLFKLNKITRQQMSTILARNQVHELTPIKRTFKILDEQGEFTKEAQTLLLHHPQK